MAAGAVCWVSGQSNATAQDPSEGLELLRAVKRVIDEDLIDKPDRAAEILGVAIADHRGPNEEISRAPIFGAPRPRKQISRIEADIQSSDKPQRTTYKKTSLSIHTIQLIDERILSDAEVIEVFGTRFTLHSSIVRPHWNQRADFTQWRGKYPAETLIYNLVSPRPVRLSIRLNEQSQVSTISMLISRD